MQSYKQNHHAVRNEQFSNNAILITALSCLGGLILIIGATLILSRLLSHQEFSMAEAGQDQVVVMPPIEFSEGYSMILPSGFQQESKREYENGTIVYRFGGEERCKLTFAIVKDKEQNAFAPPPLNYTDALIKGLPELSQGIDGEIMAERVGIDGMSATLFRFYEKETYRGVVFTYYMVAMDSGTKLVVKITGKYGGYDEHATDISMPEHWYDSMLTLKHVR